MEHHEYAEFPTRSSDKEWPETTNQKHNSFFQSKRYLAGMIS